MSWNPSSRREAWRRLRAAAPPGWVLDHSLCVEGLALAFARIAQEAGEEVDVERVQQGAILHDIGRSITQDVTHAAVGADLLRAASVDEQVVRVVERHTGAGIPQEEVEALGLPPRRYMPEAIEEKIVAQADNLFAGNRRLGLDDVLQKYRSKGLDAAAVRVEDLHHELERRLSVVLADVEPAGLEMDG